MVTVSAHAQHQTRQTADVKTWSICYNFTYKRKLVMYNFADKVVEWCAKNGFVGSLTTAGRALILIGLT